MEVQCVLAERILDVNLAIQSRSDFQGYAIYVASARQIPYFTDGLKPVLRKILWCLAHDYGGQGFIKTAKVVGNVMAKYNPHGDSGVESALRNMINAFSTKYPTVLGDGSWGTKVDPYAAQPRYNDCKISKFGLDVFLRDIEEDSRSTDWQSNYDNKCMEPVYLPARIPSLLILGQVGIAVGVKCSIPSHNLGQVIDKTIELMHNPKANVCLIPDECMPCEIIDTDWQTINDTGSGTYISQGIVDIGEYEGFPALYVRSLPDFTFYDKIEEQIRKLVKTQKMPYIIDLISHSGVDKKTKEYKFEEIIKLKKGTDPNFVKEFLYANTAIRQTRQVNMIVINHNNLEKMNYKEYLLEFITFRRLSVYRRLNVRLQTLKTKIHESELFIKLHTSGYLKDVIQMVMKNKSGDRSEIIQFLMDKLRVDPIQAKFLAGITIPQMSLGYLKKCQEAVKRYNLEIKDIMAKLLDRDKLDEIIIDEMLEIKRKYNDKVLCKLITKSEALGVAPGMFKLVFTKNNFVKKMNVNDMVQPAKMANVKYVLVADNTENVIVFTSMGKAYKIPVHKIQFADANSDGVDLRILNKNFVPNIVCAARESTLTSLAKSKAYIFVVSRNGYIKKISINDILNTPVSGIIYSKLDQGDKVQGLLFGPDKLDVLVYSKNKVLRVSGKQIPYLRRSTKGRRASTAASLIDGINFLLPDNSDLVVITNNGYVNKIPTSILTRSECGKAGTKVINLGKNDGIAHIWPCKKTANIIVREGRSTKAISVEHLKVGSSISNGEKMITDPTKVLLG